MNKPECARVLAKIQLGDNRQVDALVLEEWFDTIGHLNFDDAIAAVRQHRQESDAYLAAVHVVRGVSRLRERALPPRALPSAETCSHKVLAGACVHCGWLAG
jgi:hypothetical protein